MITRKKGSTIVSTSSNAISRSDLLRINTSELPFETEQFRAELTRFLNQQFLMDEQGRKKRLGSVKWGVYAFYDYDGEPIYVGQTKESLGTRIRRHLTNQRTDSVAMSVLDPMEVHTVAVWPLPQFQSMRGSNREAAAHLDALEHLVFKKLLAQSKFKAVLNEKPPQRSAKRISIPKRVEAVVVSAEVSRLRDHPDLRIARRAMALAKLAQVICARKVQKGLRKTLLAQARRLEDLARRRYENAAEISTAEAD